MITAGQTSWTVYPSPQEIAVQDGAAPAPRVLIEAAPDPMLRWLWGRAPDTAIHSSGDPAWTAYLRRMLTATTQ